MNMLWNIEEKKIKLVYLIIEKKVEFKQGPEIGNRSLVGK